MLNLIPGDIYFLEHVSGENELLYIDSMDMESITTICSGDGNANDVYVIRVDRGFFNNDTQNFNITKLGSLLG